MIAEPASATSPKGGDKRLKMLDAAMRRQQFQADALLEVLHSAQELYGFLSGEVLLHIGRSLKVPPSRVYGVATFYNHFSLKPKGEHTCTVCMGTACYVKGAGEILGRVRDELGLSERKSTTDDGKASVVVARCVGACGIAPAVVFDQEVAGGLGPEAVVSRVRGWIR
ncbi:MAG TPA: bidirectional hydrogenase complex protein HoxE [Anaeromyxobacter sp.]|nr:bidirectional hydrogenase complex protein HoxE [Anaeromyxobacter sp.]